MRSFLSVRLIVVLTALLSFAAGLCQGQTDDSQLIALADCVFDADWDRAAEVLGESTLPATQKENIARSLRGLRATSLRIVRSFAEDERKTLEVAFVEGKRRVQILGAGTDQVAARFRDRNDDVRIFLFGTEDLAAAERFKRLGGDDPASMIAQGLIALEAGKEDLARKCFASTESTLGDLLAAHLDLAKEDEEKEPADGLKPLTPEAFQTVLEQLKKDNPGQAQWQPQLHFRRDHTSLHLSWHRDLVNLDALEGVRINSLSLVHTRVKDLTPIANKALRELEIAGSPIESLEPLRGIRLVNLQASRTLEPRDVLHTMDLKSLDLSYARVSDIGFLAGLELERLSLRNCPVRDIEPLGSMRETLRRLELGPTYPHNLDKIWNFKLTSLVLREGTLYGIGLLRNLPLERFEAYGDKVDIGNLHDLAKMPLKILILDCAGVRDVRPLCRIESIQRLAIPADARGIDDLRRLPNLDQIALIEDDGNIEWKSADEFWKAIDAAKRR